MPDTTANAPVTPAKIRKIRAFLDVHERLSILGDGLPEYLTDAEGKLVLDAAGRPQIAKREKFDLGLKARYALLYNLPKTEKVLKRVQKLRDDRITELSGGTNQLSQETDAEKIKALQVELEAFLDTEETVELRQIPVEDLRLDVNKHLDTSFVIALGDLVSEPAA